MSNGQPRVVLVHGALATPSHWSNVAKLLTDHYEIDVVSLIEKPKAPTTSSLAEDLQVIERAVSKDDRPVHLVGHSYGGALAAAAVSQLENRLASLTLLEPTLWQALAVAGPLRDNVDAVHQNVQRLAERGAFSEVAEQFVGFWAQEGTWAAMPAAFKKGLIALAPFLAREILALKDLSVAVNALSDLGHRVLLMAGAETRPIAAATVAALRDALPRAQHVEVEKAGHFSLVTHPRPVADAIEHHLAAQPWQN